MAAITERFLFYQNGAWDGIKIEEQMQFLCCAWVRWVLCVTMKLKGLAFDGNFLLMLPIWTTFTCATVLSVD